MKRQKIARISITLPADLLHLADQEAARQGRSRSWVIAEAIRHAVSPAGGSAGPVSEVRETVVSPYAAVAEDMEQARERRLRAALALSPSERLGRAEELVRLARAVRPRHARAQVIGFDTFEDFWRWKKAHRAAGAARS